MPIPRSELVERTFEVLQQHKGQENVISMSDLFLTVTGDSLNPEGGRTKAGHEQTRIIRSIVHGLRFDDRVPICMGIGGGYYIATTEAEMKEYLERFFAGARRKFQLGNRMSGIPIENLAQQYVFDLTNDSTGEHPW